MRRDNLTGMPDIESLVTELRQFVAESEWSQFHNPKNLAMLLASEVGELVAEYRWVPDASADEHSRAEAARARIVDEIGDVGIALLLLCAARPSAPKTRRSRIRATPFKEEEPWPSRSRLQS